MKSEIIKQEIKRNLYTKKIKKYKKRIIVGTLFGLVVGVIVVYLLSFYIKDKYEARAICYCVYDKGSNDVSGFDYSSLAKSNSVCKKVLKHDSKFNSNIDIDKLQKNMSTNMDDKVGELSISVSLDNKEDASSVASLVAHCFCEEVKELTKKDIYKVVDKDVYVSKIQNSKHRLVLIFLLIAVFGFVINILLVCKKALTSNKILLASECSLDGELDVIGILPDYNKIK